MVDILKTGAAAGLFLMAALGAQSAAAQPKPPADAFPPKVFIATGTKGSTVEIVAVASDNVGVSRVDFYVDGSLQAADSARPFLHVWYTTGAARGSHALKAKAYDLAGNIGESNTVTVTLANRAQFVSQSAAAAMEAGKSYAVSLVMKNAGDTAWTAAGAYRLGSQNPQDNTTWGVGRVELAADEVIAPGQSKTFQFSVNAPAAAGEYDFQWRLVQEQVEWFGDLSANVSVSVSVSEPPTDSPAPSVPAASPASMGSAFGVYHSHGTSTRLMGAAGLDQEGVYEWSDSHMAALGAHWTRFSLAAAWTFIEPTLDGGYDWTTTAGPGGAPDSVLGAVYESPNDINAVVNIQSLSFGSGAPTRSPFTDPAEYQAFVQALAERYDGDGDRDAPTASPIRVDYFQLANEMQDWFDRGLTADQYAEAARMTLEALRAANPAARLVLVGGFSKTDGGFDPKYQSAIQACKDLGVDFAAIDIHWWFWTETATEAFPATAPWQSRTIPAARQYLDSLGLGGVQIWSMEDASWVGCPDRMPAQTEEDQARTLVKRFVWGRANGLDKLFWSQLLDFYNFNGSSVSVFNSMGLVDDGAQNCSDPGRLNTTRRSYWAYQRLAQTTDNLVASPAGTVAGIHDGSAVFAYQYTRRSDSQPLYVLWREGGAGSVALSVASARYTLTSLVPDRYGNFSSTPTSAQNDRLTVLLDANPVLVVPDASLSTVDASPPTLPAGLEASAVSSSQVDLSWTASTDNVGIAGYQVYRDGVQVASAATNSYTDSGLSAGTTYTYAVAAYDAAGNVSAKSASASAVTLAVQTGGQGFILVSGGNMVTAAEGAVSKIDPATDQIVAQVSFATTNVTIAADPTRRLIYAAASDGQLAAFRADTLERADIPVAGLGRIPIGSAVTPDGRTLLLTTRGSDGLRNADDRLDVVSLNPDSWPPTAVLAYSVPTGTQPINVMLDRSGRYAVVTVRDDPAPSVLVLDLQTRQTVLRAALPAGSEPEGLDMHPAQDVAYVLNHGTNKILVLDLALSPPQIIATVPILSTKPGNNPQPSKGKFAPDGRRMFVAGQSTNEILMFDTSVATGPVQDRTVSLAVGAQPHGIVFLPGDRAYVANTNNGGAHGSISVLQDVSGSPSVSGGEILASLVGPNIFLDFTTAASAPALDAASPTVPAGLKASAVSSSRVDLSWTASTDDVAVAGYQVYRDGVQAATTASTAYSDTGRSAGTTYAYAVTAYDAAGNVSAKSASVSAATPGSETGTAVPVSTIPIHIVFDLHIEDMGENHGQLQTGDYNGRRAELIWLSTTAAASGAKLSLQTNGEYAEFALENGHASDIGALIAAGHDVGTHAHPYAYYGPHDWRRIASPTIEESRRIWTDNKSVLDRLIVQAGYDAAKIDTVISAQAPSDYGENDLLMREFGYPMQGGGRNETFFSLFGHDVYNPWRPGSEGALDEDLAATYVVVPHTSQIGTAEDHGPMDDRRYLDNTVPALKKRFLMLYLEWRQRERTGKDGKVFVFGWNSHPHALVSGLHRKETAEFLSWLGENFIGKTSPRGNPVARYSTFSEVRQAYLGWEAANPGASSFEHKDGDSYPYSMETLARRLWNQKEGQTSLYESELKDWTAQGIRCHKLSFQASSTSPAQALYVVWSDSGAVALDFSGQISGGLKVTDLLTGTTQTHSPASLRVTGTPLIVEAGPAQQEPPQEGSGVSFATGTARPNSDSTISLHVPSGGIQVSIPAAAFPAEVAVTVRALPSAAPRPEGGMAATGLGAEIEVAGGLQPSKPVTLTIGYRDSDVAGLDETQLVVCRYDEERRKWLPIPSTPDPAGNAVSARTDHFSTFQVMNIRPAAGLDAALIYPNPFRPTRGHSQVFFRDLSAGASVSIYTLRGRRVWNGTASASGLAVWDGKNEAGLPAASGVYLVLLQSGGSRRVMKLAVVR